MCVCVCVRVCARAHLRAEGRKSEEVKRLHRSPGTCVNMGVHLCVRTCGCARMRVSGVGVNVGEWVVWCVHVLVSGVRCKVHGAGC